MRKPSLDEGKNLHWHAPHKWGLDQKQTRKGYAPLTDGVLILLFLWAVAAVILEKAAKEPDPSCHVFFREGDEHPMSHC